LFRHHQFRPQNTDGNDSKGVDEWTLFEVIKAAKQGAMRPCTSNILTQVIAALNFQFDFRKKITTNMEQLKAKNKYLPLELR
jgi:hypothetical protein